MEYRDLISAIQRGDAPPAATIRAALNAAGKTPADLIADAFSDPPPRPGRPCARCPGRLGIVNTRRQGSTVIRYIGCRRCGFRPDRNKIIGNVLRQ
jgi:hypothetical protein